MKRIFLLCFLLTSVGSIFAQAKTINLAWDDTQIGVKYRVYHKLSATAAYVKDCTVNATTNCRDAGTLKTFAWTGAGMGTHYFVVTAYMADPLNPTTELESTYSNEVSVSVAPVPPTTLRVVSQTADASRKTTVLLAETNIPSKGVLEIGLGGMFWNVVSPAEIAYNLQHSRTAWNTRPHSYYKYRWTFTSEDGQRIISEGDFTTL